MAEYKRASPSKGDLNLGLGPAEVAAMYRQAGAAALSVLTEEDHFKGRLDFLTDMLPAGLPMLRKDFLFHPLQVRHTAATPASALLLIVRMFADLAGLQELSLLSGSLGLECVVEVFDRRDLDLAKAAGARIIQVNNRDLETLSIDRATIRDLIPFKESGELWIAASGISRPQEVADLAGAGFDAVLVGTSLMQSPSPEAALTGLVQWRSRV
ncbi:MAG: indole-3-glycerol-phosphate synthase [Desulfohalobiaceae bacterium]